MKVGDFMTRGVLFAAPDDTLSKVAGLMLRYGINGFPVLERGRLVGMITQGDFLRRTETGTARSRLAHAFANPGQFGKEYVHSHGRTVGEVMTRDVVTTSEDASLSAAVELMLEHHINRLPVVKGDAVVGIISRVDFLRAFLFAAPNRAAKDIGDAAIGR